MSDQQRNNRRRRLPTHERARDRSRPTCPACGGEELQIQIEPEIIPLRLNGSVAEIRCDVPVHTCTACGLRFTRADAADLRHAAVCHAMGLLSPREIRRLRRGADLTRIDLESLSGIGRASISRWERGTQIQSRAMDRLLRLLAFAENVVRLRRLNADRPCSPPDPDVRPTFRLLDVSEHALERESHFQLRRTP